MVNSGQSRPAGRDAPAPRANLKVCGLQARGEEQAAAQATAAPPATWWPPAADGLGPAAGPPTLAANTAAARAGVGWIRPIGIREGGGTSLSNLITLFLSLLEEKFGTSGRAAEVGGQRRGETPEPGSKPPAPAYLDGGASGLQRARGPAYASFHLPGLPSSSHPRAPSQVKSPSCHLVPERTPGYLHTRWLSRATSLASADVLLHKSLYLETTTCINPDTNSL